jgi:hypothetical protein
LYIQIRGAKSRSRFRQLFSRWKKKHMQPEEWLNWCPICFSETFVLHLQPKHGTTQNSNLWSLKCSFTLGFAIEIFCTFPICPVRDTRRTGLSDFILLPDTPSICQFLPISYHLNVRTVYKQH